MSLNPPIIKDIIVTSEDTRIATRLSELSYQIINQHYLTQQSRQIRDIRLDLKSGQQCFFRLENKMCYQDQKGDIVQAKFQVHKNVKILAIMFTEDSNKMNSEALNNCIYGSQTQLYLRKHYLSVISKDRYLEKQSIQRKKDRERDQDPKRKEMHAKLDKIRY